MSEPKWGSFALAAFRLAIALSIPACACAAASTCVVWLSFADAAARRGSLRAWTLTKVYECSAIDAFCTDWFASNAAVSITGLTESSGVVALATLAFGVLLAAAVLPAFNLIRVGAMLFGRTRGGGGVFGWASCVDCGGWRGWLLVTLLLHAAVSIVGGASAAGFRSSVAAWASGPYASEVNLGPGIPMRDESGYGAAIACSVLNGLCAASWTVALLSRFGSGAGSHASSGASAAACDATDPTAIETAAVTPTRGAETPEGAAASVAISAFGTSEPQVTQQPPLRHATPARYVAASSGGRAQQYPPQPQPSYAGDSQAHQLLLQQQIRHLQQLLRQYQSGGEDDGGDAYSVAPDGGAGDESPRESADTGRSEPLLQVQYAPPPAPPATAALIGAALGRSIARAGGRPGTPTRIPTRAGAGAPPTSPASARGWGGGLSLARSGTPLAAGALIGAAPTGAVAAPAALRESEADPMPW